MGTFRPRAAPQSARTWSCKLSSWAASALICVSMASMRPGIGSIHRGRLSQARCADRRTEQRHPWPAIRACRSPPAGRRAAPRAARRAAAGPHPTRRQVPCRRGRRLGLRPRRRRRRLLSLGCRNQEDGSKRQHARPSPACCHQRHVVVRLFLLAPVGRMRCALFNMTSRREQGGLRTCQSICPMIRSRDRARRRAPHARKPGARARIATTQPTLPRDALAAPVAATMQDSELRNGLRGGCSARSGRADSATSRKCRCRPPPAAPCRRIRCGCAPH